LVTEGETVAEALELVLEDYEAEGTPLPEALRQIGSQVKFLSLEPLLGPLPDLGLRGIDWVIVGGESGPGARPMDPAWAVDLRNQCQRAGVLFFFKQWGGVPKHKTGRVLEGRTWDEVPVWPGHAGERQQVLCNR
jgi:protein gp37